MPVSARTRRSAEDRPRPGDPPRREGLPMRPVVPLPLSSPDRSPAHSASGPPPRADRRAGRSLAAIRSAASTSARSSSRAQLLGVAIGLARSPSRSPRVEIVQGGSVHELVALVPLDRVAGAGRGSSDGAASLGSRGRRSVPKLGRKQKDPAIGGSRGREEESGEWAEVHRVPTTAELRHRQSARMMVVPTCRG
jgi:hypothetical protein